MDGCSAVQDVKPRWFCGQCSRHRIRAWNGVQVAFSVWTLACDNVGLNVVGTVHNSFPRAGSVMVCLGLGEGTSTLNVRVIHVQHVDFVAVGSHQWRSERTQSTGTGSEADGTQNQVQVCSVGPARAHCHHTATVLPPHGSDLFVSNRVWPPV